jgi:uncharacterized integral membrane protein
VPTEWPKDAAAKIIGAARAAQAEAVHVEAKMQDERRHSVWTIFSAGALALAIFLVYSFINAGTKGHMAWALRIVSLGAFALLCLGLLVLRGHIRW